MISETMRAAVFCLREDLPEPFVMEIQEGNNFAMIWVGDLSILAFQTSSETKPQFTLGLCAEEGRTRAYFPFEDPELIENVIRQLQKWRQEYQTFTTRSHSPSPPK